MISRCRKLFLSAAIFGIAATGIVGSTANATVLYDDGPPNGTYNAWPLGIIEPAEDSFNLASTSTLTGVTFGNWIAPSSTGLTVGWFIVDSEGSQTPICAACIGTAPLTAGATFMNARGFDVVDQSFSLPDVVLGAGTYWLALSNEIDSVGGIDFWDMNGGPSLVWESGSGDQSGSNCLQGNGPGTCSNSFQILGTASIPEPMSLALFGSGLVALFMLRRRVEKNARAG